MPRPDFKHRDAVYQTLCAQIVREATDLQSLAASAARALGHPDVSSDPMLGWCCGFIVEREAYLMLCLPPPRAGRTSRSSKALRTARQHGFPTMRVLGCSARGMNSRSRWLSTTRPTRAAPYKI